MHLYAIGSEQEPSSVTKRAAAVKDRPPDSAAHSYFGLLEVSQHALSHVLCDQTQAHSAVPLHQLKCITSTYQTFDGHYNHVKEMEKLEKNNFS